MKYNSIEEILDHATTDKEGVRRTYAEIGSADGDYSSFKNRYEVFKDVLDRDFNDLTLEEIVKIHKNYHRFRDLFGWVGLDYLMYVLEWEINKDKDE